MAIKREGKTYVIVTDDGPFNKDVFLTWTTEEGGYYTTVDCIDEVGEYDFHGTVKEAEDRARDADSGTFGGWPAPTMTIYEVLNFNEAITGDEEPELKEIKTISL